MERVDQIRNDAREKAQLADPFELLAHRAQDALGRFRVAHEQLDLSHGGVEMSVEAVPFREGGRLRAQVARVVEPALHGGEAGAYGEESHVEPAIVLRPGTDRIQPP